MKDNSFERAMNQIVNQAEAEQQAEMRAQRRAILYGRLRRGALVLTILAITGVAFHYRDQVNQFVSDKFASLTGKAQTASKSQTSTGAASTTVAKAQANASVRDQIVDQVASGQFDQASKSGH